MSNRNDKGHVKGYHPDADVYKGFTDAGAIDAAKSWAANEREHESFGGVDKNTHCFRADLLEALVIRLERALRAVDPDQAGLAILKPGEVPPWMQRVNMFKPYRDEDEPKLWQLLDQQTESTT